ncbi:MAG TPA: OmpA family protein [Chitinophagaceae bacterium]|nr:OmpA family protein [Chitinophagaceae bacterium]
MASKKYLSLIGLLCLLISGSYAQLGGSYDVQDSSVIPSKRLPQHSEFMSNAYPFPAMPRNQWELGLKVGAYSISGDVRSRFPGLGVAVHARKALGYVFSLRGELGYGTTKGLNFQPSSNYLKNPAWAPYVLSGQHVFYNYKSNIWDLSIQGVVTLNNIRFHKAKTGFNMYLFGGFGGMIYDTKVDALNGNTPYDFQPIYNKYVGNGFSYKDRKDIKKDLKNLFDGSYETTAEQDKGQPTLFDKPFRPIFNFGAGMQFKLNKKFSLAVEDKITVTKSDLLDGQQWQENDGNPTPRASAQTRDFDNLNFLSVGINMAVGGKSVEPLWWMNPLDYAYNELNKPRHMQLPKPVLDDADGDGVTDQFDNEPNTPAGAPVDSHGVSRDTDGDGVPDYKDKELITPTQCQPVDADGVGKCPEPACCDSLMKIIENGGFRGKCDIGDLPSISFRNRSVALSNDAKALLASVASRMRNHPDCKVAVVGYCASSKSEQQLSWDRVNAIINYLIDKEGISGDRFIFKYGEAGGDCNTVDLRDGTGEEGPTTVPAPHPNLRRRG